MDQSLKNPETIALQCELPLAPYLILFAKEFSEKGYALTYACRKIWLIRKFGQWLNRNHISIWEISEEQTKKYLRYRARKQVIESGDAFALKRFLDLLRYQGVTAEKIVVSSPAKPAERLIEKYVQYLQDERGLAVATIALYRWVVYRFLDSYFSGSEVSLSNLSAAEVIGFVQQQASIVDVSTAKHITCALRSFLQFARYQNYISSDLVAAVPRIASWSLASLPKAITLDQIDLALLSCNRQTAAGKRDYAVLLLLARLGLRAGEIASLELMDIDWEAGQITVHGKSGRRPRLPLLADVGEALSAYLRDGRPRTNNRAVFLSNIAPNRSLCGHSICRLVERALTRAGSDSPRKGAHQFRHALATTMLRQGASLAEIGELLGHRSPNTTAIYAKFDLDSLRTIAWPWPGGAQ